jgi:hypothetical protein
MRDSKRTCEVLPPFRDRCLTTLRCERVAVAPALRPAREILDVAASCSSPLRKTSSACSFGSAGTSSSPRATRS